MQLNAPIIKKQWIEDCVEDDLQYEPNEYFHAVPGAKRTENGFWSRTSRRKTASDVEQEPSAHKVKFAKKPILDYEDEEDELDVFDREAQDDTVDIEARAQQNVMSPPDSDLEHEGQEEYTSPPTARKHQKRTASTSEVTETAGRFSFNKPSTNVSSKKRKRDALVFPDLPPAMPTVRLTGRGFNYTEEEIEWAEEYCRICWTLDPSMSVGDIAIELCEKVGATDILERLWGTLMLPRCPTILQSRGQIDSATRELGQIENGSRRFDV